ncbi:hypothetical protein [Pseudomonas sp. TUM22785]|uniref:hypothetical protein n=1 Tax=Pseudomonas sp. TUM22785 TaxID=3019098 RepID=UPI002306760A|nr:hypothetical protein [Pseudomonas sp. TUM22785]WCD83207.1 hypothetical protein PI990_14640 [Pseudomonas sp. TUM22785]
MESNLDRSLVEELLAAPGLMHQHLLHALATPVEVLEFRTRDEGLCDARLYHCGKAQAATPAQALIALLNRELHQVEEWALEETTPAHVGDLMERWLLPELANAQPTRVDIDKATLEITSLGDTIRSAILARHADTGRPYHSDRWGIFRDGQPQPLATPILPEPLIAPALALQDSWNEKLYFCETRDTWLLYSWATGA